MQYRRLIIFLIFLIICTGHKIIDLSANEDTDNFKVVIFKEDGFPYIGTPEGFTADWLGENIGEQYDVSYYTAAELKDSSLFNVDKVDLLILPYGEAAPEDALSVIIEFVKDGGGLFSTAGRPFGSILEKDGKSLLLELGLNYYSIDKNDIESLKSVSGLFDLAFDLPGSLTYDQYGLCIKTSERIHNKPPTKGNVFPHRIPARDFIAPVILKDKYDNYIGTPVVLIKNWSNPYKISERVPNKSCLIGFIGEAHPLNPKDTDSVKRLRDILKFLSTKIVLTSVQTEYASYRRGEPIKATARVLNYGADTKKVEVVISIMANDNILVKKEKEFLILPQEAREIELTFEPEGLESDFYEVKAALKLDGNMIDEGYNGFTVWHKDKLAEARDLTVKGRYFYRDGEPVYLYGINYYETRTGGLMWVRPNISDIEKDIKTMSGLGINFLRVHYHHPKWFRDYLRVVELPVSDYFQDLTDSPLPDESSLRILDAFIILCNKYNVYFQPDLFTLVPEEMGDPEGWIGDVDRCTDNEKIRIQKEFVKILSERYKDIKNISWDLWNEPFLGKENLPLLRNWAREMVKSFRSSGDKHLITLGSSESAALEQELDFICGHGHDIKIPDSSKPFVMQEIWNESDLSREREAEQTEKLERDFTACLEKGGAGFAPWQWTRQACLWDDASDSETWDDELGLCVREDGSLKPAGRRYRDLIRNAQ